MSSWRNKYDKSIIGLITLFRDDTKAPLEEKARLKRIFKSNITSMKRKTNSEVKKSWKS